jgi:transposase-like protein
MAKNNLANPIFSDETAARQWFETTRWPNGPICPKCGSAKNYPTKKAGVYRCAASTCRKDFTVMTGTVMERSHAKLTLWAAAFHLAASSKKGFSAHQLHRELGCQYNTAWFLHHRVMEAMRRGNLDLPPMGGDGSVVEADETYFGTIDKSELMPPDPGTQVGKKGGRKRGIRRSAYRAVFALVERGGSVRTFHVAQANQDTVHRIMRENITRETHIHTDESGLYKLAPWYFAKHETVKHSAYEYARGDVTTNTVEGYFSIFKRGMKGVYQHCKEKHLHRYLAEFDFRYNTRKITDMERTVAAVRGGEGKRLTYHQPR